MMQADQDELPIKMRCKAHLLSFPQPAEASFEHAITTCQLKPLEPIERDTKK